MKKYKIDKYNIEEFDSLDEFRTYLNTAPNRTGHHSSTRDRDRDWSGTSSYEEAEDLLKFGYHKNNDKVRKAFARLDSKLEAQGYNFHEDSHGFTPIVPRAIIGHPLSMMRRETVINRKGAKLFVELNYNAGVSSETIFKNSLVNFIIAKELDRNGIKTEINIVKDSTDGDVSMGTVIRLKRMGEPFGHLKMSYPMMHTSFYRRHIFRWIESNDYGLNCGGYGRPGNEVVKKLSEQDDGYHIKFINSTDAQKLAEKVNVFEGLGIDLDKLKKNIIEVL